MAISNSIPTAPGGLPLLGHLVPLVRDPLCLLRSLPAHGDLVRIGLGPVPAVVVCDPGLTEYVLRHDHIYDKGGPIYRRGREVLGDGLGTCSYSVHRRQRRLLQPAFGRDRIRAYAQETAEQATACTGSWRDGQILDVYSEMKQLTSAVMTATMFSDTVPDATARQAGEDLATLVNSIARRALVPPQLDRLPTPGHRAFARARTNLRDVLGAIVTDRRCDGTDHGDLLAALLSAHDADGLGLTGPEIADQVITFFGAGVDTSATTLAWALYLIDRHPAVADRLHREVDTVIAGRPAHHADLPKLPVTGRIITETLRMYPPGWLFTRTVTEDTDLGGYHLRAGTIIVYSPYLIHHRSDLYPGPERFDPDRPDPARGAFIPFGGGARKCIGNDFAVTGATLALATLTACWELHVLPGTHVRPARSTVLHPARLRMRATIRKHQTLSTPCSADHVHPATTSDSWKG